MLRSEKFFNLAIVAVFFALAHHSRFGRLLDTFQTSTHMPVALVVSQSPYISSANLQIWAYEATNLISPRINVKWSSIPLIIRFLE